MRWGYKKKPIETTGFMKKTNGRTAFVFRERSNTKLNARVSQNIMLHTIAVVIQYLI